MHHQAPSDNHLGLVVLADHWGRHPSSAQHLVRHLMHHAHISWINSVGTRRPRLCLSDARRALGYLNQVFTTHKKNKHADPQPEVLSPLMYPGFRTRWQRSINRMTMHRAITRCKAAQQAQTVGITTLPLAADLVGVTPVDRWIYYAVDDFSVWPGLDHEVMRQMETELIRKVDHVVAVSENIRTNIQNHGVGCELLTHGIDIEHWRCLSPTPASDRPVLLFWGVIDQRLDTEWCRELTQLGQLILAGPQQDPDPSLLAIPDIRFTGPIDFHDLPSHAQRADVLVMPYADLPVTRAMQPLKFKEYLATGRPVVARALPGIHEWHDAADLVTTTTELTRAVQTRFNAGVPETQQQARRRLGYESWSEKADHLHAIIREVLHDSGRRTAA
ncbi:glycosyltransferase [Mucisphaera calidilacus]|uniref:Teichuronic acid biosynthesis glycosyltransferase TuaH n=1 Tax=Mucisphaera calidilacus TaxID=2527982 RepID=A0A518BW67_9BACT|nr:glycosyltransferase [Mucisphaera calidilacus]QDU71225.1 Putative teichuronic acid biosynthesis glycosyltransferase TuaH [Mucisphaera calidilacus]